MSVHDPHGFESTMKVLEASLLVEHIATFGLRTCATNAAVKAVLADLELNAFDHIPVCDSVGEVVGVLNRAGTLLGGSAREAMVRLDESFVIDAGTSLVAFLRTAEGVPFRLVRRGGRIDGIVTRSDLLKLPVRVLAFALVTHLEALMADAVRAHHAVGDERWLELLDKDRREKILEKRTKLSETRSEPELLELTDFCDKRELAASVLKLGNGFVRNMQSVEKLRNPLAHAATIVEDDAAAAKLAKRITRAEKWIEQLTSRLVSGAPA